MNENLKFLLCEDDPNLGMLLREYLNAKGYASDLFYDGEAGYDAFLHNNYDMCILDVMMPKKDGFTLAADIRQVNTDVPIVFLTAKVLKEDVLEGFKVGADDYITKPFSMEELTFRIEAILRRVNRRHVRNTTTYQLGRYEFDSKKQTLTIDGTETKLTTKENDLLTQLALHANEVLQRDYALKTIWSDDTFFTARSMDVYITRLRKRLADDPNVQILNNHGKGYTLIVPAAAEGK